MNDILGDLNKEISKHITPSAFNFQQHQVSEVDAAVVSEQEQIFFNGFRKYRNNLYSMCEALSKIEETLKPTNSFMAWYESVGLSKDMVSVLLKRWTLFQTFLEHKEKVFSLSDQAIKFLTHKDVTYDNALAILECDITKAQEIKELLGPVVEKTALEFKPKERKYFNFSKVKKWEKQIETLTAVEVENFKKELADYIKELQELYRFRKFDDGKTFDENQYSIYEILGDES